MGRDPRRRWLGFVRSYIVGGAYRDIAIHDSGWRGAILCVCRSSVQALQETAARDLTCGHAFFAFAECGRAPQRCALGVCHNVDVCSAVYRCPDVRMSHCAYVRQFSCVTTPCHDVSTCMWRVRVCVCASYARAARALCGRRSPLEFKIAPPGYARAGRARCNCASESGSNEPRRRSRMLAKGVKRDSPLPFSHPLCIGSVDIARRQSCASKHSYRPRLA